MSSIVDFAVDPQADAMCLTPLTPIAEDWVEENFATTAPRIGRGLQIERKDWRSVLMRLRHAGLRVGN